MTMVKPITCRKCKGSGTFVSASGMPDSCSWCVGAGVVEGDKATNDRRKAVRVEHDRVYGALRDLARAAKAIASIENGHPGVVKALAEYYKANR